MKKVLWFSLFLIIAEVIAGIILYNHLPEQVPIHWDAAGNINGYGGRMSIFLAPSISAAITLLLYFMPQITPKGENALKSGKAYPAVVVLVNLLMAMIMVITAIVALGGKVDINVVIPFAVGILMIGIGNYLPKIKQNYIFGIRLPWTLDNEEVWVKTHRLGGYVFLIIGVLFILGSFLSAPVNYIIPLVGLVVGLIAIGYYSWSIYNKLEKK